MKDALKRYHCEELKIRAYTAETTGISRELCAIHNTTPNAMYALSQGLTAAALLSAGLKPESAQSIAYKIEGNGPLKSVYIQADARGSLRGYVSNPDVDNTVQFQSINFSKAIGAGSLTVTKELGLKEPYAGVSALMYGSIARDTAYYLTSSEQIPSAVIIACETTLESGITAAGGILIQTFPDTPDEVVVSIEEKINSMPISLGSHLVEGIDISLYLTDILMQHPLELLSEIELKHRCSCSREVILQSLAYIAGEDLQTFIEEDNGAEISCTFCRKKYHITAIELQAILDSRA